MTVTVRHKKLRDGRRETVYLDIYVRGRRWCEHLGLYLEGTRKKRALDRDTLALADDIAAKRRLELTGGEFDLAPQSGRKADFIAYCRRLAESGSRSPNTQLVWRNAIAHLEAFAGGSVQLRHVTPSFLEGFRDYLLSRLKQNSAAIYLVKVKQACRQAARERMISANPAAGVSITQLPTHREFLTLEELDRLAVTPCDNPEIAAAFLFASFSGLRYSDVKALRWHQVRRDGEATSLVYTQAKTRAPETLPLSPQAAAILDSRTDNLPENAVFKLGLGSSINKALKRWAKRAGIGKNVSFHTSRHSFAVLSLSHGVDVYSLSKLLGHKRLQTTEIYAKITDEKKRAAVEMLPRLKGGRP